MMKLQRLIKANIETCKKRDTTGKYEKTLKGKYVYEEPQRAEIVIDTDTTSVDDAVDTIIKFIKKEYIK